MKPNVDSRIWLMALVLILSLVLVACVRPLQDEEEVPAEATPDENQPAEPADGDQPSVPEAEAPSDDTPDTGEPPGNGADQPSDSGDTTAPAQPITYLVQPEDTLAVVAGRYSVTVDSLATANGLTADATLQEGQVLIIPAGEGVAEQPAEPVPPTDQPQDPATEPPTTEPVPPTEAPAPPTGAGGTHTVQSGEWLYSIGRIYGCSGEAMVQANNHLPNPHRLQPGDVVNIPPGCGG